MFVAKGETPFPLCIFHTNAGSPGGTGRFGKEKEAIREPTARIRGKCRKVESVERRKEEKAGVSEPHIEGEIEHQSDNGSPLPYSRLARSDRGAWWFTWDKLPPGCACSAGATGPRAGVAALQPRHQPCIAVHCVHCVQRPATMQPIPLRFFPELG
jgi:hypothetical protein